MSPVVLQVWQVPRNDSIGIVPRDLPLVPIRVASVFATKEPSEVREPDDGDVSILEKFREVSPSWGKTLYFSHKLSDTENQA